MKIKRLALALACLALPFLVRGLWFYRGIYSPSPKVNSPDFSEFTVAQPPLSTVPAFAAATNGAGKLVLFDQSHNNKYTLAEIESLRNQLLMQGAEILETKPKSDVAELLKKADAFVIITPTDFYTQSELQAVEEFVNRGGRLMVIADPTRSFSEYDTEREESVILTNEILQPFRISFRNDYVYSLVNNEGNYRNVYVQTAADNLLTNKVSNLVFYATHSLDVQNGVILTGDDSSLSSLDDQGSKLPVAALDESGDVLVIGDMTFLSTPYNQVADNYQLIINISDFLLGKLRTRTLADFPELFTRPVSVQLSEGISLDEDLLAVLANLKANLSKEDLPLTILQTEEKGFDQIILGTYPPNEKLQAYTGPFGIDFNNTQATSTPTPFVEETATASALPTSQTKSAARGFSVPGFGNIPSEGFGFLLLQENSVQTSLIILADSQKNAINLLSLLVTGSLDTCLANDFIAVCQQDAVLSLRSTEEISAELSSEPSATESELLPITPTVTEIPPSETPTPTPVP